MGYDLDIENKVSCPCGEGNIIYRSYSNDWGQYKDEILIDCESCKEKYNLIKLHPLGIHLPEDDWTSYYLINKDIPVVKEPATHFVNLREQFYLVLIKSYDYAELVKALQILDSVSNLSKVVDFPKCIIALSRKSKKSAKRKELISDINLAISNYYDVEDNYENYCNKFQKDRENYLKFREYVINNGIKIDV